ncbi:hypothetical protein ACV1D6_03305, partial [Aeromonas veronii]
HARGNSGSPDDRLIFYLSTGLGEPLPFYLMRSEMSQFREEGDPPPESDGSGKIIHLADYLRRK